MQGNAVAEAIGKALHAAAERSRELGDALV
jgi:hypothetical protein